MGKEIQTINLDPFQLPASHEPYEGSFRMVSKMIGPIEVLEKRKNGAGTDRSLLDRGNDVRVFITANLGICG